jgi:hypothetical protein
VSVAGLVQPGTVVNANPIPPGLDHFAVYPTVGAVPSVDVAVELVDQFGGRGHVVTSLNAFLVPTTKNSEPINDPRSHLSLWTITEPTEPSREVVVDNQFGEQMLMVGAARYLLAPALKNPQTGDERPDSIGHFKCYDAFGPLLNRTVTLQTQFGAHAVNVVVPVYLCNPAEKRLESGEVFPMMNPDAHLVCYDISSGSAQNMSVVVHDQFLEEGVNLELWPDFLCVPSFKTDVVQVEGMTWGEVKAIYR